MAVSTLMVGGCVAGTVVAGPCFFDPPPGDVQSLAVINDTSAAALVTNCDPGAACAEAHEQSIVQPGGQTSFQVEACMGGALTVTPLDLHHQIECLTVPTEDADGRLPEVTLSGAHRCGKG